MGNLLTIHADVQADHLHEVMAEMERFGPPKIRVVDVGDSHIAIEGTHRLAAAELLGLAPEFEVLDDDERIDVSDMDIDVLLGEADEDGTMRALDIAWMLKGSHNGEYFVGEDGRLEVVYRHIKGEWDGPARRQPSFDELIKAVGDKDNAEWRIAYKRLVTMYPATACLEIDGTSLTENDLRDENVVAFDPDTDRLVECKIWERYDGTQWGHVSTSDYDTFVRDVCFRRIGYWSYRNDRTIDDLAVHVSDYLRHGGSFESHPLLKANEYVAEWPYDYDDDDEIGWQRSAFVETIKTAVGDQDLTHSQCLDVLSAKVQEIMAPKVSADIDEMVTRWTRDYNNGEADMLASFATAQQGKLRNIAELADLLGEHRIDLDAVRHLLPEADGEDGCRLMDAWFRFGDGDPILITHHGDALLRDGDVSQLAKLSSCETGMHGDLVAVEWDVVKGRIEHALDATDSVEDVERLESWLASASDTTPRLAVPDGPREFPPSAEVLAIIEGKSVDSVGIGR